MDKPYLLPGNRRYEMAMMSRSTDKTCRNCLKMFHRILAVISMTPVGRGWERAARLKEWYLTADRILPIYIIQATCQACMNVHCWLRKIYHTVHADDSTVDQSHTTHIHQQLCHLVSLHQPNRLTHKNNKNSPSLISAFATRLCLQKASRLLDCDVTLGSPNTKTHAKQANTTMPLTIQLTTANSHDTSAIQHPPTIEVF